MNVEMQTEKVEIIQNLTQFTLSFYIITFLQDILDFCTTKKIEKCKQFLSFVYLYKSKSIRSVKLMINSSSIVIIIELIQAFNSQHPS